MHARIKNLLALPLFLAATPALAASFNPGNATELQAALATAEASTEDDVIQLNANTTYAVTGANTPFTYSSSNDGSLTLTGSGPGSSILEGNGVSQIMSLTTTGANAQFTVQGIRFQNANSTVRGGGLQIGAVDGPVQINDSDFSENVTSDECGGMAIDASGTATLTVTNSTFRGNEANGGNGGGLCLGSLGEAIFMGNTVADNQANSGSGGGARLNTAGGSNFQNNTFTGNESGGEGGGLYLSSILGDIIFNENTFSQNSTSFEGGAAYIQGRGFEGNGNSILNNQAGANRGGLSISATGDATFDSNVVTGNTADFNVGGLAVTAQGSTIFSNNIVAGNEVGYGAGAGYIGGDISTDIINNTIFGNTSDNENGGASVFVDNSSTTLNIYNNIIFGNVGVPGQGQDMQITNSSPPSTSIFLFNNDFSEICFRDGSSFDCDLATILGANQGSNINADPLLIDPTDGNFNLGLGSPAIDTGDVNAPNLPATDLAGNPRIFGGGVDMGALEAVPSLAVSPSSIDFSEVQTGSSQSEILTISNQGAVPLQVDSISLSSTENFSIDPNGGSNPCGSLNFTLDGGESCTVAVVFFPTETGSFTATVTISSNDPTQPALAIAVTGTSQISNLTGGGCRLNETTPTAGAAMSWIVLAVFGVAMRRILASR